MSTFVRSPLLTQNVSLAALFREMDARRPTVLFDEIDTVFVGRGTDNEDLRGALNGGHRRGATIPRCVGENHDVRHFHIFGPVAFAGIGLLPDTLLGRSIIIPMRRRARGEVVKDFRERETRPEGQALGRRMAAWVTRNLDTLADARPQMPPNITDRTADIWEPLFAIADLAGGNWGARARAAAVRLQAERRNQEPNLNIQLLVDIRRAFTDAGVDRLASEMLIKRLVAMHEVESIDVVYEMVKASPPGR